MESAVKSKIELKSALFLTMWINSFKTRGKVWNSTESSREFN